MDNKYSARKIIKRSIDQSKPYWFKIIIIFILSFLASGVVMMKPLAMKLIVDNAFGSQPIPGYIRIFFPADFNFSFGALVIIASSLVLLFALLDNIIAVA